ncbi:MAG: DUF2568 domain-containing protein [Kineosporiaceae bacterium]
MQVLKVANLALAFALELAVLVALVVWGFAVSDSRGAELGIGIAAAVAWAAVWGLIGAPNAKVQLTGPVRLAFELVWFGVGAVALVQAGHPVAGAVLIGLWALNAALLRVWKQTSADLG